MRTGLCSLIVVAAASAGGCWPQGPLVLWQRPTPQPQPVAAAPVSPRPRAPVTADQVNADNAIEKANALLEEVNREQARATRRE